MYDELIKQLRHPWKNNELISELTNSAANVIEELSKRVPKMPHGRLIDADTALKNIKPINPEDQRCGCTFETTKRLMMSLINNAPTIIEAEEDE